MIQRLDHRKWGPDSSCPVDRRSEPTLEAGAVLLLPELAFDVLPAERELFSPSIAVGQERELRSGDRSARRGGQRADGDALTAMLAAFQRRGGMRWSTSSFRRYAGRLQRARASFRPAEIAGRQTTWRHGRYAAACRQLSGDAGAGAAHPAAVHQREPRRTAAIVADWRAVRQRGAAIRRPAADAGAVQRIAAARWPGITKSRRTPYDALMLQLHDRMKADLAYQSQRRPGRRSIFRRGRRGLRSRMPGQPRRDGGAVPARADISPAGRSDAAPRALAAPHPRRHQGAAAGLALALPARSLPASG